MKSLSVTIPLKVAEQYHVRTVLLQLLCIVVVKSFLKFDQSEQWVCLKYYKEVLTLESIDAVPHCCHANLILHNSCCFLFNFQTWPPCLTVLISIRAGCLTVFFEEKKRVTLRVLSTFFVYY